MVSPKPPPPPPKRQIQSRTIPFEKTVGVLLFHYHSHNGTIGSRNQNSNINTSGIVCADDDGYYCCDDDDDVYYYYYYEYE
eukprot:CAMPEP_0171011250 /NCGR_PEP_ID=MMETSP0736-20130129/22694_1 /TAXON_ID=186038 /ORGANISM="Fragilariopsis kerguelensis, Strain L26-C5" /LENGTH=80 /DNA_ID=CAMNT_0011443797 /DNA_START=91 /DNA_END=333 /DNA_ORIENTATION=+